MNSLQSIYERHHEQFRDPGFTVFEKERGRLLRDLVGVGKSVLDIGCRDGALTQYYNQGNTVVGVDIDQKSLSRFSERIGGKTLSFDLNGGWEELNEEKFDVIVMGEVLEHLYYPSRVLDRVAKHLVPNGVLIGTVPNGFSLKNRIRLLFGRKKNTPLSDPTHINHFTLEELRGLLEERFVRVEIFGLGRYKNAARLFPGFFAFDLFFVAYEPRR